MDNYGDCFFSFKRGELREFDEIDQAARSLSVLPQGFDSDFFEKLPETHPYHESRKAVYELPDLEKSLGQEAQSHLKKVMPNLRKQQLGSVSIEQGFHDGWVVRTGYLSWLPSDPRLVPLISSVANVFGEECPCSGHFLYPRYGFRAWHTNKFDPGGWNMFLIDVDSPRGSFFRFIDPSTQEMVTHWDEPGDINFFRIDSKNLFWHCIVSEKGNRWSQGFIVPETWQQLLR